jgi:hypothetical protein
MQTRTRCWISAIALLTLTPTMALGDHKMIRGRTGLPLVRAGAGNVWMERGVVQMNVSGNTLVTTQEFRLHYPGPPLETGREKITVALREEFFRSTDNDAPKVTTDEARGFTSFAVTVDGRRLNTRTTDWMLNDKEDTATRWREWDMAFQPNQVRQMRIVTRAPLGEEGNRKYVDFRSKDLADWREAPAYLEIRFSAPGRAESRLAALEPRPNQVNVNAVQWVYRKARPRRDIYLQMPLSYNRSARR